MGLYVDRLGRELEWKTAFATITFTGATGLGAVGTVLVFTVTGVVITDRIFPFCTVDLTEAAATATIALGIPASTAGIIAATTATAIDVNEFWLSTTPATAVDQAAAGITRTWFLADTTINCTVATQNVNGGTLEFWLRYMPLSVGATVV